MLCFGRTFFCQNAECPKFWISKNVQFRHMCCAFRFWSNFGWPKIWGNPCWSPHSIALACYPWLILVINCDNEVCSSSNNTVSKAFWQKKILPEQKISCCRVIYLSIKTQMNAGKDISHAWWFYVWWFLWWNSDQYCVSDCNTGWIS